MNGTDAKRFSAELSFLAGILLISLILSSCFVVSTYSPAVIKSQQIMGGSWLKANMNHPVNEVQAYGDPAGSPVHEIDIPQSQAYPLGITLDSAGNVWFAEAQTDLIVEYFVSNGTFHSYPIPVSPPVATIWFLCFDAKGYLWFADPTLPLIWRFSPEDLSFDNFTTGFVNVSPYGLAYQSSTNQLWFTSPQTNQLGFFQISQNETPSLGMMTNIPTFGRSSFGPAGITLDSSGDVFVSVPTAGEIDEYSPQTQTFLHTWLLPINSQPVGIAVENDSQKVWFTNHASSLFGYLIDSTGSYVEFSTSLFSVNTTQTSSTISLPYWIETSPSGLLWFNEHSANKIARFDPTTMQLDEFNVPTASSEPLRFVLDESRGLVWFTEFSGDKLGVMDQNASSSSSDQIANNGIRLSASSLTLSSQQPSSSVAINVAAQSLNNRSISGPLTFNGLISQNLTISYKSLNSSSTLITVQRGADLNSGNYSITICPTSANNMSGVESCALLMLNVSGAPVIYNQILLYLVAPIAVAGALVISLLYIRKWRF